MGSLLADYDAVLLDLDGTVYHGKNMIDGVPEVLRTVREQALSVRFVTNNASKAPSEVVDQLRAMGIAAAEFEVKTSAQAGAHLLQSSRLKANDVVLVVGTDFLAAEVTRVGFQPTRTAANAAAVIQGHSPQTGWPILAEACAAIRAGALWVACNVDPTLPTERGLMPGNGAMVAALKVATDVEPIVAGKPEALLFQMAVEATEQAEVVQHPLVAGDRLDTDIAGAVAAGFDSLLVLSGVSTPRELLSAVSTERPDYVALDLNALTQPAQQLRVGHQEGWRVEVEGNELVVSGDGSQDAISLLRALCVVSWESGADSLHPAEGYARTALRELDLT